MSNANILEKYRDVVLECEQRGNHWRECCNLRKTTEENVKELRKDEDSALKEWAKISKKLEKVRNIFERGLIE